MTNQYCHCCNRPTGWKRRFGLITIILVLATWGWWLLAMLLYPKRCAMCGMTSVQAGKMRDTQLPMTMPTQESKGVTVINNFHYHGAPQQEIQEDDFFYNNRTKSYIRQAPKMIEMEPQQQIRGKGWWRTEDYDK